MVGCSCHQPSRGDGKDHPVTGQEQGSRPTTPAPAALASNQDPSVGQTVPGAQCPTSVSPPVLVTLTPVPQPLCPLQCW